MGNPLVRFCEGLGNNSGTDEILWHRRETRRQTEKTNFILKVRGGPSLLERGIRHNCLFLNVLRSLKAAATI